MSYPSYKILPDTSWSLSVPGAESVGKSFCSKVGMMFLGPSGAYKVYIGPTDYPTSYPLSNKNFFRWIRRRVHSGTKTYPEVFCNMGMTPYPTPSNFMNVLLTPLGKDHVRPRLLSSY